VESLNPLGIARLANLKEGKGFARVTPSGHKSGPELKNF
jgi:hypothetical protein